MTAEVLDYRINQIANITDSCIYDDKSLDEALFKMVKMLKEKNNTGWIPCSSGKTPQMGEFDIKKLWVTMHRKGIDFYFTRKVNWNNYRKSWEWLNGKEMADDWEIVAWMYIEIPEPYQPEGEQA